MPLVIMSGTTVGSLCFLYGNKVAKRNCAPKFSLTMCWTPAASSVGFESLFMNNPVSFWGVDCLLTSMATSQGHGLTWNSLPREFFFLIWDRRQPKRPGHTPHDRLQLMLEKGMDVVMVL